MPDSEVNPISLQTMRGIGSNSRRYKATQRERRQKAAVTKNLIMPHLRMR